MIPHTHATGATRILHLPQSTYANSGRKPHKAPRVHIAGESLDWAWLEADRQLVYHLWREGTPGLEICERVGRYWLEVLVLIDEGVGEGILEQRKGGFLGPGRRVESTA
jgi:hypothetical protein